MTGHVPDFGMLMVGANAGIVGMTKEHLGLALALRWALFFLLAHGQLALNAVCWPCLFSKFPITFLSYG